MGRLERLEEERKVRKIAMREAVKGRLQSFESKKGVNGKGKRQRE